MSKEINVKKRNGRIEPFNADKINKCVERACKGLDNVSASEIVLDAQISFTKNIKTSDIDKELIYTARSKMFKHYNYSKVAARLLLNCLYKEVFKESVDCDTFLEDYKTSFIKNIKKGVKEGVYSDKLLDYDLKELSEYIKPNRDDLYHYVGIQNLYDRYFLRINDKLIETPQHFHMRIAMGVCINDENKEKTVKELYDVYSNHLASASTPTLFNSGTPNNQLSSCYLSEIGDSINGIFDGLWQEARKSKHAGGLGFHMSKIRGMNSRVKGTNGKSGGLIPWLKIYNDMLIACDQGGKRKGSGCVYVENWHIDVEEFLDLRKATGDERRRCHDLNTALWISSLFMERVHSKEKWTLFCPAETPELPDLYGDEFNKKYKQYEEKAEKGEIKNFKVMDAVDLWKKMLKALFETSHPWMTFKDPCNIRYSNIHEGVVHGSNLCTEICLHSKASKYKDNNEYGQKSEIGETAVCNLASICLPNHMVKEKNKWKIDYNSLKNTIKLVIRALDNVIDINFYPTEEAQNSNSKHRPIGLGSMGWADVYQKLRIPQDSKEAIDYTHELMEFISYYAIEASSDLAKERGKYSTYEGSKWSQGKLPIDTYEEYMDWLGEKGEKLDYTLKLNWEGLRNKIKDNGMRNSNTMAIAPNASISYILGCEQSIEPPFRLSFRYENMSGNYFIVNKNIIEYLEENNKWNESIAHHILELDGDISESNILDDETKSIFKASLEQDQLMLIKANAARQKFIDQAISFNLYNGGKQSINEQTGQPSLKFLHDIYTEAHRMGLKTTYYLRNKASSSVNKLKEIKQEEKPMDKMELLSRFKNGQPLSDKELEYLNKEIAACSINGEEGCAMCEG